jgi:hypothetical protein
MSRLNQINTLLFCEITRLLHINYKKKPSYFQIRPNIHCQHDFGPQSPPVKASVKKINLKKNLEMK